MRAYEVTFTGRMILFGKNREEIQDMFETMDGQEIGALSVIDIKTIHREPELDEKG